jgi:hypothetical protein
MLAADGLRLAAVELLCPTAALASGTGFPTMALSKVFDSRAVALDDLDAASDWTPVLSVYSEEASAELYGDLAPSTRGQAMASLVIEAEIAVRESDESGAFADAAKSDADAKLMLGALCAQVRKRLVYDPAGNFLRRRLLKSVVKLTISPFSVPQLNLRWMRATMNFLCHVADDDFTDAAGLPEPLKSLMAALPPGSYALARLTQLSALFEATNRDALSALRLNIPPLSQAAGPPASNGTPSMGITLP